MKYDGSIDMGLQAYFDRTLLVPPDGVELRRGAGGFSLHATRPVRAGDVIYSSNWFTIADAEHSHRVTTIVNGEPATVEVTRMHSVRYEQTRSFDVPGCFMNHACEPTSISVDRLEDGAAESTVYDEIALVDLEPGDEITCDYTLFDWDCDGHTFTCRCGSSNCYGEVSGLQGLPRATQERLAPRLSYESARMWAQQAALQDERC